MTMPGALYRKANVYRLYMKRGNGGCRLISVRDYINMAEYLVISKENLLQYAASAEGVNKAELESAHEYRTRTVNEREETLFRMELRDRFHSEIN